MPLLALPPNEGSGLGRGRHGGFDVAIPKGVAPRSVWVNFDRLHAERHDVGSGNARAGAIAYLHDGAIEDAHGAFGVTDADQDGKERSDQQGRRRFAPARDRANALSESHAQSLLKSQNSTADITAGIERSTMRGLPRPKFSQDLVAHNCISLQFSVTD